jgi:hypothetical protein
MMTDTARARYPRRSARIVSWPGGLLVAVAAAAGVSAVPASAAPASAPGHVRITWGINQNLWDQFLQKVPRAHGVRVFYNTKNHIPIHWPAFLGNPWVTMSLRPMPGPLLSGKLDAKLRRLIRSAPPHSQLTIWHEDAVGNNPLGYPTQLRDPARYRRMQEHMERLVKGSNVRFGTIGCGAMLQAEQWFAPHLDWYGYDLYDNSRYWNKDGTLSKIKIWQRMSGNLVAFRAVSRERNPQIVIGEANSPRNSHRANWFTFVARWFDTHGGRQPTRILTFWHANSGLSQGGLSGPWPPSKPVIRRLAYLANKYA